LIDDLIYSDLICPGWVAAVGQTIARNLVGFPTAKALNELIKAHRLAEIYLASSWLQYEGVFQKK
jgi:hypothetical protein